MCDLPSDYAAENCKLKWPRTVSPPLPTITTTETAAPTRDAVNVLSVDCMSEDPRLSQGRVRRVQIKESSNQVHDLLSGDEDKGNDDQQESARKWYQPEDFARFRSEAVQQLSEWLEMTTSLNRDMEGPSSTAGRQDVSGKKREQVASPPVPLIPTGLEKLYHRLIVARVTAAATAAAAAATAAAATASARSTTACSPQRHYQGYTRWIIETHKRLVLANQKPHMEDEMCEDEGSLKDDARSDSADKKRPVNSMGPETTGRPLSNLPGRPRMDANDELRLLSESLTRSDRIRAWRLAAVVVRVE
jgi:hypothetical protein